jgi:hypothetical protein
MPNEYDILKIINSVQVLPTLPPDISKLPSIGEITDVVLPPTPPYPVNGKLSVNEQGNIQAEVRDQLIGDKIEQTIFGTPQQVPISVKLQSEENYWLFPVEPLISIDGKNIIIKRNVAKRKVGSGTIKEYWTQDDWTINISGLITDSGINYDYPREDILSLIKYCTAKEPLDVKCAPLELIGINRIVIESYSLPFTKGPENQNYTIVAYSDTDWSLILKKKVSVS